MWSIIFVPYQKVEKNAFEGMRQKKKKNYRCPDLKRGPKEQKSTALSTELLLKPKITEFQFVHYSSSEYVMRTPSGMKSHGKYLALDRVNM